MTRTIMMTRTRLLLIALAAAGASFGLAGSAGARNGAPGAAAGTGTYNPAVASAVRTAALFDAQEELWLAKARCLNGPVSEMAACMADAQAEYLDAVAEAHDQFDARIDIGLLLFGSSTYCPDVDPAEFSPMVTNPLFPLPVGQTWIYQKMTSEGLEQVEMTVMPGVQDIDGVPCRIVRAVETVNGEVMEDTIDWYSQKSDGSVWYLGEIAQNFEEGLLDNLDGSWRTGKDGAKPGIIMLAAPAVGDAYWQEFLLGDAEDIARVTDTGVSITVPFGTFPSCLETTELSPLEPGKTSQKFYAPGIGLVREFDPENNESLELVQVI